jgi:hypothetical protein
MSDTSRSVLPYRDGAERAAEVRRRRMNVAAGFGAAAILVVAAFAAFVPYRRAVMAERARLEAEKQALVALLQQQQQRASQSAAATTSAIKRAEPSAESNGGGVGNGSSVAAPSSKTVPNDQARERDSGQSALVRATAARIDERHAEAARLMAEAFAADADLADDLESAHPYLAACSAALAAAGKGADAKDLSAEDRERLRKQALSWLRDDLKARAGAPSFKQEELLAPVKTWIGDADLAGVRDPAALFALPAEEQQAWKAFWKDVAAQRARVEADRAAGGEPSQK